LSDQQQVSHLQELVDAQSTALGAVRRIEDRLRGNSASVDRLRARRAKQQPLRLLATLGNVLPQNCWVQRIEWDGVRVRIAGYCAQDAKPVAVVKASGAFTAVRASRAEALAQTASGKPFDFNALLERSR
jgi:Tfp pilus assembly protein PilN